jgi:hypothetical protein
MEWVRAGNEFMNRLNGGFGVWFSGIERGRTRYLKGLASFYAGIDHTLLVCAIVVLVLGAVFWFSLRGRAD